MKYFKNFFIIISLLLFSSIAHSENAITYIDLEKVLNQSLAGKKITKLLFPITVI